LPRVEDLNLEHIKLTAELIDLLKDKLNLKGFSSVSLNLE